MKDATSAPAVAATFRVDKDDIGSPCDFDGGKPICHRSLERPEGALDGDRVVVAHLGEIVLVVRGYLPTAAACDAHQSFSGDAQIVSHMADVGGDGPGQAGADRCPVRGTDCLSEPALVRRPSSQRHPRAGVPMRSGILGTAGPTYSPPTGSPAHSPRSPKLIPAISGTDGSAPRRQSGGPEPTRRVLVDRRSTRMCPCWPRVQPPRAPSSVTNTGLPQ